MKRKKLYETRKNYYKWIWQYERRCKTARESLSAMEKRIEYWKTQMKNMDERTAKIIALANAICLFTGINVKNSVGKKIKGLKEAKYIFYKYGLENGIRGVELENYVGHILSGQAAKYRKEFNESFFTTSSNEEFYRRFLQQFENTENEED